MRDKFSLFRKLNWQILSPNYVNSIKASAAFYATWLLIRIIKKVKQLSHMHVKVLKFNKIEPRKKQRDLICDCFLSVVETLFKFNFNPVQLS